MGAPGISIVVITQRLSRLLIHRGHTRLIIVNIIAAAIRTVVIHTVSTSVSDIYFTNIDVVYISVINSVSISTSIISSAIIRWSIGWIVSWRSIPSSVTETKTKSNMHISRAETKVHAPTHP